MSSKLLLFLCISGILFYKTSFSGSISKDFNIYKDIDVDYKFSPPIYKFDEIIQSPVIDEPELRYSVDDVNIDPGLLMLDFECEDFDFSKIIINKTHYIKFGHTSSPSPIFDAAYAFHFNPNHYIAGRLKHKSRGKNWSYFDSQKNKLELFYIGEIKDLFLRGRIFVEHKTRTLHLPLKTEKFSGSRFGLEFGVRDIFSDKGLKFTNLNACLNNFAENSAEKAVTFRAIYNLPVNSFNAISIKSKFSLGNYLHNNIDRVRNSLYVEIFDILTYLSDHHFTVGIGVYGDKDFNGEGFGNLQILPNIEYKYIFKDNFKFYAKPIYSYSTFKSADFYTKSSCYISKDFDFGNEYGYGSSLGTDFELFENLKLRATLGYLHRNNFSVYSIVEGEDFYNTALFKTNGEMGQLEMRYAIDKIFTEIFTKIRQDIFVLDGYDWIRTYNLELGSKTVWNDKYTLGVNLSFLGDQVFIKKNNDAVEMDKYPLVANLKINLDVKLNENWYVFASLDNILAQSKTIAPKVYDAPIMISLGAWYVG